MCPLISRILTCPLIFPRSGFAVNPLGPAAAFTKKSWAEGFRCAPVNETQLQPKSYILISLKYLIDIAN